MSGKVLIADGFGSGQKAGLTAEGAQIVSLYECPPVLPQKQHIFRQYLTTNGESTGTSDMRQTGTLAAPISFYIPAHEDADRYITILNIVISDATITGMHTFGAVAALTNGCQLYYRKGTNIYYIHENINQNWEIMRLCNFQPTMQGLWGGGAAGSVQIPSYVGSSSDVGVANMAVIGVLDFTKILPPYGLKLDAGSAQRLVLDVRDTTTGVDEFNMIAMGFDREL